MFSQVIAIGSHLIPPLRQIGIGPSVAVKVFTRIGTCMHRQQPQPPACQPKIYISGSNRSMGTMGLLITFPAGDITQKNVIKPK